MLSRIAESLYWVGRHIERAEDTARILDVQVHRMLEDRAMDETEACRGLLGIMGVPGGDGPLSVVRVTEALAYDRGNECSIVSALNAAREHARGAREAISSEMWESLNATWNSLPGQVDIAGALGPHAFFRFVKERAAIIAGLADSTMSRDDGWRFLVLGRSLERVDMTARLLWAAFSQSSGPIDWAATLRSCSAYEAFLRTYRRNVDPSRVAEFLLLDRLFPRSAIHALGTAEQCLAELDPRAGRVGLEDEARRILGRARTELEFRRVGEMMGDLPTHLEALQGACTLAHASLTGRFFRRTAAVHWSRGGYEELPP